MSFGCRAPGVVALAALALLGCKTPLTPMSGAIPAEDCEGAKETTHSVFLIGDAGAPELPLEDVPELVDPVLRNLREHVLEDVGTLGADQVGVIFLGDNVYFTGLAPEGDPDRRRGERVLEAQIAAAGPASAAFMAGNHDWHVESAQGWEWVTAQRRFLETKGDRVAMLPPGGCAGPNRVDFGPYLRFVFLDQVGWWHTIRFPEEHKPFCPHDDGLAVFHALADEFDHPEGRHVVLAMHHPLITVGPHGGHYTWKQHLFPLTDFWSWAWFPLPIIGSAYPLSRQLGVTGTDVTSETYQRFISAIYRASRPRVPAVIAAGHEHSLQVHRDAVGLYYLVSGSGSKVDRVQEGLPSTQMALAKKGYMRLESHAGGSLGLNVIAVEDGVRKPVYRHCLAQGPPKPPSR